MSGGGRGHVLAASRSPAQLGPSVENMTRYGRTGAAPATGSLSKENTNNTIRMAVLFSELPLDALGLFQARWVGRGEGRQRKLHSSDSVLISSSSVPGLHFNIV